MNLKPIEAALEDATPGPWAHDDTTHIDGSPWTYLYAGNEPIGNISVNPWDVALLVNAPTWLAELVAEVKRLREFAVDAWHDGKDPRKLQEALDMTNAEYAVFMRGKP